MRPVGIPRAQWRHLVPYFTLCRQYASRYQGPPLMIYESIRPIAFTEQVAETCNQDSLRYGLFRKSHRLSRFNK